MKPGIGQLVRKENNHQEIQIVSVVVVRTFPAVVKSMIFIMVHPVQNVNFYIQLLITKARDRIVLRKDQEMNIQYRITVTEIPTTVFSVHQ